MEKNGGSDALKPVKKVTINDNDSFESIWKKRNEEDDGTSGGTTAGTVTGFWWPIEEVDKNLASITSRNSPSHFGIDIASDSGEKGVIDVIAAYDGEVIVAENDVPPEYDDLYGQSGATSSMVHDGYGNYVVIKHNYNGETLYTYYAHMTQAEKLK